MFLYLAALYEWVNGLSHQGRAGSRAQDITLLKTLSEDLARSYKGYSSSLHQPLPQSLDLIHCPENSLREIVRCVRATHIWSSDFALKVLVMPEQE